MVEAVGGGLHTYGDVVAEVAGLTAFAEEVHGEEVVYLHALEENFGSACEVGTLTGVDGEHGDLDFGHLGGNAVHDGLEFRLCFRNSRSEDSSCQCQSLRSPAWKTRLPSARVTINDTPASVEP